MWGGVVLQASRARHSSSMAKVYSENSFLKRQRLSRKAPDEELAVIENGDSRSGLHFLNRACRRSDVQTIHFPVPLL